MNATKQRAIRRTRDTGNYRAPMLDSPLMPPAYSQRERAALYATHFKPALLPVARQLGYKLGRYSAEYHYTILIAKSASDVLHSVCLNWREQNEHGIPMVRAELKTRERKARDATDWGQIVNAICHGVPDAWGEGDRNSPDLLTMVRSAIEAAQADLQRKRSKETK